jgi:hypothetical protein
MVMSKDDDSDEDDKPKKPPPRVSEVTLVFHRICHAEHFCDVLCFTYIEENEEGS